MLHPKSGGVRRSQVHPLRLLICADEMILSEMQLPRLICLNPQVCQTSDFPKSPSLPKKPQPKNLMLCPSKTIGHRRMETPLKPLNHQEWDPQQRETPSNTAFSPLHTHTPHATTYTHSRRFRSIAKKDAENSNVKEQSNVL